ncbi:MAG: hypothetical protein K0Q87_833 [Neobacillus sp.]|jgi:hypothetical protein|nr:hypothetical protein [Neobacillus sp.]
MLIGLRCMVNGLIEGCFNTYVFISNGSSVPFFNYTTMDQM